MKRTDTSIERNRERVNILLKGLAHKFEDGVTVAEVIKASHPDLCRELCAILGENVSPSAVADISDATILEKAHRNCFRYRHNTEDKYRFNDVTMLIFSRKIANGN